MAATATWAASGHAQSRASAVSYIETAPTDAVSRGSPGKLRSLDVRFGKASVARVLADNWVVLSKMLALGIRLAATLVVVWISAKVRDCLRSMWLLRKLPGPNGNLLVGQLPVLASAQHHNILAQWAAQFGGIYRMRLAHVNVRGVEACSSTRSLGMHAPLEFRHGLRRRSWSQNPTSLQRS